MIAWIRTIVFMIVFYGISAPIVMTVPISALFGSRAVIVHSTVWTHFHRWAARWILGIRIRVEGTRPAGQAFYACKHQAMFEVPSNDAKPGTVVQEIQTGYMIRDRLLRPALVGVAKAPEGGA